MKPFLLLPAAVTALAGAPAFAQAAGQWQKPEQIWAASCSYCHEQDFAPELRGRNLPAEAIAPIVRQGVPGMPAFHPSEINDRELAGLSRWISASPAPAAKKK
jgi:cytochrome c5